MDGGQGARKPKLHVVAHVDLHALEDLGTARGQIGQQVGIIAPARSPEATHVLPRRLRGDLASLQKQHIAALLG